MDAVRVALDVGPLAGPRTGIGVAVDSFRAALAERDDVEVHPYLTSFRAPRRPDVTRLPFPAAIAHRTWARSDRLRIDRWLGDAEVVHGTNYVVPPTDRPCVVSVYDCWFLDHPELANRDVRRAGRVLARAIHRGATVHACSRATAAAVVARFPDADVVTVPLAAVPLVPPTDDCPIAELRGREFVLSVATLERRKNLPALVAAFGIVAEGHDLMLAIAGGDGDDRRAVEEAILALAPKVGRRVLLTGYVADDARSWLLRNARVLAYPSLDEGFGFPLLDAMQAGVPIVATDVGSIPEVAGDAALLSPATDVDALARNLASALQDGVVRRRLIDAGPAQLASFDWRRTAAELSSLYHRLAAGSPS